MVRMRAVRYRLAMVGLAASLGLGVTVQAVPEAGASSPPVSVERTTTDTTPSTTPTAEAGTTAPAPTASGTATAQPSATPDADDPGTGGSPAPGGTTPLPDLTGRGSWVLTGGRWQWRATDGTLVRSGCGVVSGRVYCFDDSAFMRTGWWSAPDGWQRFAPTGERLSGWTSDAGQWYYLDPATGVMRTGTVVAGGQTYLLSSSGAMVTGWVKDSDGWRYYVPGSGARKLGWAQVSGQWYYLDPATGVMRTGTVVAGGQTYLLSSSGAMVTGWVKDSDGWRYYVPGSGARKLGWAQVSGQWYYLDPATGVMRTGTVVAGGQTYLLSSSGAMVTGWVKDSDGWRYYVPGSGARKQGWAKISGEWYYLTPGTGLMVTGRQVINGKTEWFYPSGVWWGYWAPSGLLQPVSQITSLGWQTNDLTWGMNGVKVRIVQQRLGIWSSGTLASVDGTFQSAVRNFQRRAGLPVTGVVNQQTWDAMGTGYSWWVDQYQATPIGLSATRSERIEAMIGYAWNQLGSSYTWGGAGPYNLGFDCSGLVLQSLYAGGLDPQPITVIKHGWSDYRTSQELYRHPRLQHVPLSQRQRGDIIFYQSGGVITHVAIYLGNNQVIHTDWMGRPARVQDITVSYGWGGIVGEVVRPFPQS